MADPTEILCIVEVGHGPNTPARWRSAAHPSMTVCDHHADQYATAFDDDTRVNDWRPICGDSDHRHTGPCHLYRPPASGSTGEES